MESKRVFFMAEMGECYGKTHPTCAPAVPWHWDPPGRFLGAAWGIPLSIGVFLRSQMHLAIKHQWHQHRRGINLYLLSHFERSHELKAKDFFKVNFRNRSIFRIQTSVPETRSEQTFRCARSDPSIFETPYIPWVPNKQWYVATFLSW